VQNGDVFTILAIMHDKWGSEKVGVQSYMASHFTDIRVSQAQPAKQAHLIHSTVAAKAREWIPKP
jgi:hypothetical protein